MPLESLKERLKNPEPLMQGIGLYLVGQAQRAFREQGRGGTSWAERSVPNRMGVLMDLQQGKTPPARRFQARPAAIDTGRLRSSIAHRIEGTRVIVGSNLPYASDIQRGGTKTVQMDAQLRRALADWLKSLRGERRTAMRRAFGFLFQTGSLTVTTPARPFLMVTEEDRRKIQELIRQYLAGGKKG